MENLSSPFYYQLGFTQCLIFNFVLFLVCVKNFRNPFFIFHLDTHKHSSWLETDVGLWISSSPFFKSPLLSCTPMWVWVYSRVWSSFFYRPSGGFNFSADGWMEHLRMPGRTSQSYKGRKNLSLYSSLVALVVNRDRSEYGYSWANKRFWLGLFSLEVLVPPPQGFLNNTEETADQACFVPHYFVCGCKQSNSKIFSTRKLYDQEGPPAATPAPPRYKDRR